MSDIEFLPVPWRCEDEERLIDLIAKKIAEMGYARWANEEGRHERPST